jgi:hypothetical protein
VRCPAGVLLCGGGGVLAHKFDDEDEDEDGGDGLYCYTLISDDLCLSVVGMCI